MAQESQVSYEQSMCALEVILGERFQKLRAEIEERQEKISIVPLTKIARAGTDSVGAQVAPAWSTGPTR
jgi:hypothetical protein